MSKFSTQNLSEMLAVFTEMINETKWQFSFRKTY